MPARSRSKSRGRSPARSRSQSKSAETPKRSASKAKKVAFNKKDTDRKRSKSRARFKALPKEYQMNELFKAFTEFDVNGDGVLTKEEIYEGMLKRGTRLSPSMISELMAYADDNNDGTISIDEFEKVAIELGLIDIMVVSYLKSTGESMIKTSSDVSVTLTKTFCSGKSSKDDNISKQKFDLVIRKTVAGLCDILFLGLCYASWKLIDYTYSLLESDFLPKFWEILMTYDKAYTLGSIAWKFLDDYAECTAFLFAIANGMVILTQSYKAIRRGQTFGEILTHTATVNIDGSPCNNVVGTLIRFLRPVTAIVDVLIGYLVYPYTMEDTTSVRGIVDILTFKKTVRLEDVKVEDAIQIAAVESHFTVAKVLSNSATTASSVTPMKSRRSKSQSLTAEKANMTLSERPWTNFYWIFLPVVVLGTYFFYTFSLFANSNVSWKQYDTSNSAIMNAGLLYVIGSGVTEAIVNGNAIKYSCIYCAMFTVFMLCVWIFGRVFPLIMFGALHCITFGSLIMFLNTSNIPLAVVAGAFAALGVYITKKYYKTFVIAAEILAVSIGCFIGNPLQAIVIPFIEYGFQVYQFGCFIFLAHVSRGVGALTSYGMLQLHLAQIWFTVAILRCVFELGTANAVARYYFRDKEQSWGAYLMGAIINPIEGIVMGLTKGLGTAVIGGIFGYIALCLQQVKKTFDNVRKVNPIVWLALWPVAYILAILISLINATNNTTLAFSGAFGLTYGESFSYTTKLATNPVGLVSMGFLSFTTSLINLVTLMVFSVSSQRMIHSIHSPFPDDKNDFWSIFVALYMWLSMSWTMISTLRTVIVCTTKEMSEEKPSNWCAPPRLKELLQSEMKINEANKNKLSDMSNDEIFAELKSRLGEGK